MLYGHTIHFSKNGGKTWDESIAVPAPEGDYPWANKGTILVEGDDVTVIQYVYNLPQGREPGDHSKSVLHISRDRGRTWAERIDVPQFRHSEGAIVRAKNGQLVAVLRTGFQNEGAPELSDHWRGITTYRSTDNGKTWSPPQKLNKYGHVHSELMVLDSGDILLTYAARIGELDGRTYHGIEAMLSHDHGKTWDWQNRFLLFRTTHSTGMHSPISVQLSDVRILTVLMYSDPMRYWNNGPPYIGRTSAVIWSAKKHDGGVSSEYQQGHEAAVE